MILIFPTAHFGLHFVRFWLNCLLMIKRSIAILMLLVPLALCAQHARKPKPALLSPATIGPAPTKAKDTIRQPYHAYIPKHSLVLGCASAGSTIRFRQSLTSPWETANMLQWDPRAAFMLTERLCIGGTVMFANTWGTVIPKQNYFGWGAFGRYYLVTKWREPFVNHEPLRILGRGRNFRRMDDGERRLFAQCLFPFLELGGGFTNGRLSPGGQQRMPTTSESYLRILLGIDIRLWKCFFFEASLGKEFYPSNSYMPSSLLDVRAGIDIVLPFHSKRP